jgi:antitoxin ParD1/3/4
VPTVPTAVDLTPELERFVEACVTSGRFADAGEVVRAGLRMLREAEERRLAFVRSLDEARAEAERDGWFTVDEVMAEIDAIIDEAEAERGPGSSRKDLGLHR